MIGEIFDNVHSEGSTNTVKENVQTTLVPAGGATIVDFKVQYPGKYILVDHALSRAGKGLAGVLGVKGREDAKVYRPSHTSAATWRTDWSDIWPQLASTGGRAPRRLRKEPLLFGQLRPPQAR